MLKEEYMAAMPAIYLIIRETNIGKFESDV